MRLAIACLLAACGEVKSSDPDASSHDAPPSGDAFTGIVEHMVNLARTPLAGAKVTLSRDDGVAVATSISAADGAFSIPVTGPLPLDGFYKIETDGTTDSYSHLVLPASTDPASRILALTAAEIDILANAANTIQQPGTSLVIAMAIRGGGSAASGVTVQPLFGGAPIPVCYTVGPLPDCNDPSAATSADGLGWMFSVPPGSLTVNGRDAAGNPIPGPTFEVLPSSVVFTPIR